MQQVVLGDGQSHGTACDGHSSQLVVDRQVRYQEGAGSGPLAQSRPDARRQLGRRERLDDVVGGARLQCPGDRLVPSIAGDEDDRKIGQCGDRLHQHDAVGIREHQVEQHQLRLSCADEARQLSRITRHRRGETGTGQGVTHHAQRQRVVVDNEYSGTLLIEGRSRTSRRGPATGISDRRQRERDPRSLARPRALGTDAAAVGLHQPLADSQAEAGIPALRCAGAVSGSVVPEQTGQPVGRNAGAVVRYRDRQLSSFLQRRNANRRSVRRVAGRVGEQVVQYLRDAPLIGHHPRQVRRQVDFQDVPGAAAVERPPRTFHQRGHVGGFGCHGQRAGFDASGIEQVSDQAVHVVGLLFDDAEELAHLGRVDGRRVAEHGGGEALYGAQRHPQLVAHHLQELRPAPLQLVQRPQVPHRHNHRPALRR